MALPRTSRAVEWNARRKVVADLSLVFLPFVARHASFIQWLVFVIPWSMKQTRGDRSVNRKTVNPFCSQTMIEKNRDSH